MKVWGIHNDAIPASQLIAEGFVSIGWDEVGDLQLIGDDKEAIKALLSEKRPTDKPRAIAGWTGVLRRFAFELSVGDLVVAPNRQKPVFNIGRVTGPYRFVPDAPTHRHRRSVDWLVTDAPRSAFSYTAQNEMSAMLTFFQVANHAEEFERPVDEGVVSLLDGQPDVPSSKRAWLVRGSSVNGRDLVPTWRSEGWISLAASNLREVMPAMTRDELKPIVDEDYAHASYSVRAEKLDDFHHFLTRMEEGHLVVTVDQGRLYLGTLVGEPRYQNSKDADSNLIRDVDWSDDDGFDYSELPGEVAARLKVQRDVVDLTQQLDALETLLESSADEVTPPLPAKVVLPDATADLADNLLVPQGWLQECIDLLNDRPQLIFYGPPGTGKTYLAQAIGRHVAGDNVRLVQFHPAYSYEDFFEGYRPVEEGGFKLKPGPMRKIVDQALENPRDAFVLIIDEINRGNLAKVFGELYFLLEYRDQNVELLYADGDFSLPKNVFIIGTMNTADRSIALVDAAMRRRFAFLPLHPSEVPTDNVLRRWLNSQELPPRTAELLEALNSQIADPDFKIGPSYFMRTSVHADPSALDRTWRTSILPLLEEHHFGELDGAAVRKQYGLDAIAALLDEAGDASPDPD